MQLFTLGSSKIEVFETYFFDIVTTQNDHPRYLKHVLGRIYMFFILFGYSLGGGRGGFGLVWVKACAERPGPRSALAFVPTRLG